MANPIKVIKLTGVSGSLEGKADAIHTHVLSDITDAGTAAASSSADFATAAQGLVASSALQAADIDTLTELNANFTDGTILVDDADPRLSDDRNPLTHTHTLSDITDSGSAAALDVPTSGDATAAQVVKGDDSRLTGAAYAPVSHTHDIVDLTGVAPTVHTHVIADITDRGTASELDVTISGDASATQVVKGDDSRLIDDRNPITHTHTVSELSDLATSDITLNTDTDVSTAAWFLDEDNLISNSDTKVPSQQSVVAYVDDVFNALSSASSPLVYRGVYDAFSEIPNIGGTAPRDSVSANEVYVVSTAGDFFGAPITPNSLLIALVNDPSSAAGWQIVPAVVPYTANEIKVLYENLADTNAFSDADKAKLDLLVGTNKFDATVDPVATDDSSANYQIGSVWVNTTTDEAFTCVDATAGAAVWTAGGGGLVDIVEDTSPELGGNLDVGNFEIRKSNAPFLSFTSSSFDEFSLDIRSGTTSDYSNPNPTTISVVDNTGSGFYQNNLKLSSASGNSGAARIELDNYVFESNENLSGKSGQVLTYDGSVIKLASAGGAASDLAYGVGWNGNQDAATKNAIYDKIETLSSGGQVNSVVAGTNITVDNSDPVNPVISSSGGGGGTTQGSSSTYDISAVARSSTPNARGNYSVDLQMQGNADDVASGLNSALLGGSFNKAEGSHSFISGGTGNEITSFGSSSVILASQNSKSNYNNSAIIAHTQADPADTTISAYNCAVIGGSGHAIEGLTGGGYSVILGGQTNSCSYQQRSVILGGSDNAFTALGGNACVIGGTRVKVANKDGVFAWADDTAADYTITQDKTANFRVANGMHITAPLFIDERASALADIAGRGQIWVKTATPNELWFTDDAGSDRPISEGVYTVATLPTGVAGRRAFVTDSGNTLASHHGQVVTNGGSNFVPVYHDGSSWHVG